MSIVFKMCVDALVGGGEGGNEKQDIKLLWPNVQLLGPGRLCQHNFGQNRCF